MNAPNSINSEFVYNCCTAPRTNVFELYCVHLYGVKKWASGDNYIRSLESRESQTRRLTGMLVYVTMTSHHG